MINIQRPKESPASLRSPNVRDYLERLARHQEDPERFPEKPSRPAEYRSSDVLEAFETYFFCKCYLTERKFDSAWEMDVEHFIAYSERPDLACEWTNLYPADHKANMLKPRKTPAGGYLDPCDENDDVEGDIRYALSVDGEKPAFQARDATNQKAANTARLLERLHNGNDPESAQNTKYLRILIQKKHTETLNAIIDWQGAKDAADRFQAEIELKKLLTRKASFTALIRSVPAVRRYVPKELLD
jgi:hypothetical protein